MPATFSVRNFVHSVYVDRKHARQEKKAERQKAHEPAPSVPGDRLAISRQVLVRPS
jgi:hypothetical protein